MTNEVSAALFRSAGVAIWTVRVSASKALRYQSSVFDVTFLRYRRSRRNCSNRLVRGGMRQKVLSDHLSRDVFA
jgi:hypothetical protein